MKTFEDLPVWQDGRELVKRIYFHTRKRPFREDRGLCDQIQRAAVSVPSNIAEGHERGTTPDLIQYLFHAKGSAGEVRSQLYNAEDLGYVPPTVAEELREFCRNISRQLSAWIQSMQTVQFKRGPKYHKEPDTTWEDFASQTGMERQSDGRYKKVRETRARYGTRNSDGTRKTGKRKKKK